MDNQAPSRPGQHWLTLAPWRNLPLVWSHCLAGAWLGGYWPGAERWDRLATLLLGASAVYVVAMLVRNRWDKQVTVWSAWLAGVPILLYPLASAVSAQPTQAAAIGEGMLVASYVLGASLLARGRSNPDERPPRWSWLLMVLPLFVNAVLSARFGPGHFIIMALPGFWLARVAFGRTVPLGVSRGGALRAGSVLVDLSALVACTAFLPWLGTFAILFVLALACERLAPEA